MNFCPKGFVWFCEKYVQLFLRSPIWEISGAEFTLSNIHTANKLSIRFPKILKVRDDKDFESATGLAQLQELYDKGGINRGGNKYVEKEK